MRSFQTLRDLRPGQSAAVLRMDLSGPLRRRLRDMGLIEGARMECLGMAPGGDPAAYLLSGAVIALRRRDSERIIMDIMTE